MVIVLLTTPLLQAIPRVYYESWYSEELFGKFASVAAPTIVLTVLIGNALTPLLPKFAEYYTQNDRRSSVMLLLMTVGVTLVFGAAALIVAYFFGEFALVILYGEEIRPYAGVLSGVIVAVAITCVISCFQTMFIAARKLGALAVILVTGCCICYAVTPYLVGRFEMDGISYATIISQIIQVFLLGILTVRMIRKIKT